METKMSRWILNCATVNCELCMAGAGCTWGELWIVNCVRARGAQRRRDNAQWLGLHNHQYGIFTLLLLLRKMMITNMLTNIFTNMGFSLNAPMILTKFMMYCNAKSIQETENIALSNCNVKNCLQFIASRFSILWPFRDGYQWKTPVI